jgi:uncharacterized membrane protein YhaH (DUF805 family)
MDPASSEPSLRASGSGAVVVAALVGASLLGATFAGDGSDVGGIIPVGGSAVVLLAAALVAVAFGWLPVLRVGRSGAVLVGSLVLLVAWIGTTVWWSIVGDRSWDTFNKGIAYVAFLGLGIVLATLARERAARLAGYMLALVIGVTLTWGLVTKAIPALVQDERIGRLNEPVDHWNALALLADAGIVLGLWLGTAALRRPVRVAGALLAYAATLALALTLSRAGLVVGAGVLVLWFVLTSERVESALLLVASAGPAEVIAGWAFTRPALTDDLQPHTDRVADGRIFGVAALVGALLVVALVALGLRRSLTDESRHRLGRLLLVAGVALAVAAVTAGSVAAADSISSDRSCSEVVNDPSRLGSLDVGNRLCWWGEAWDVFAHRPHESSWSRIGDYVGGAGAGTFEIARKRFRPNADTVTQPHSVPLQQLADGGVVAFGLFAVLVLAGIAACVCAVRRLHGPERAAAVALVTLPAAYLGHALVDYNWDFLAVTAPTMVALGVLAGAGRETRIGRRRPVLGVGIALLAAVVLVSYSFPRLADRAERRSTEALAQGDLERALDEADWAQFFNPVSADPIIARARVAEAAGVRWRAERLYIDAVELQPGNPFTWYTLGTFEFDVRRNMCAAYRFLNEAWTRDPAGNQWTPGGPLDVSRDAVNNGACPPGS